MANQGFWTKGFPITVDRINAGLLQFDTLANRPAASQAGRLFYATDTNELFRDSGTAWDSLVAGEEFLIF